MVTGVKVGCAREGCKRPATWVIDVERRVYLRPAKLYDSTVYCKQDGEAGVAALKAEMPDAVRAARYDAQQRRYQAISDGPWRMASDIRRYLKKLSDLAEGKRAGWEIANYPADTVLAEYVRDVVLAAIGGAEALDRLAEADALINKAAAEYPLPVD